MFLLRTLLIVSLYGQCFSKPGRLETYNVDSKKISIFGFSSGAFFTVQFHVAHSSILMGAGVSAGAPYYCIRGNLLDFPECSFYPDALNVTELVDITHQNAKSKSIDSVDGMKGDRIMLVLGQHDKLVWPGMGPKLVEYYSHFIDGKDIRTQFNIGGDHAMFTNGQGAKCDHFGKPFISDCGYSTAFNTLHHIYGDIAQPNPLTKMKDENLLEFDQREFSGIQAGLGDVGYVYVPTACKDSKVMCRLHIALHGCLMYRSNFLHDWITEPIPPFVKIGGFNELAELNNIIVLYPQTRPTIPNPLGCFDAYGYTGPDYAIKKGPQIMAVKAMLDRVADLPGQNSISKHGHSHDKEL